MYKNWIRICSMLVVVVMLINMLPASALAAESQSQIESSTVANRATVEEEDVYVLDEVIQNRTKYSKEFRLSNGLNMAAVYASPVHYEKDGHWEEIDNTLKLSNARSGNVYTNTASGWQVAFPQNLTGQTAVTITKDGYTLSFYMSGELRATGEEGTQFSMVATEDVGQATYILEAAQDATAEIQEIDTTEMFANAQFKETVTDKLVSCLRYDNVYENTDIVYKLDSMQVKESIIMEQYDEDLHGYSYILDVGEMEPVLTESKEIKLYDQSGENLVMLIPMPYLVDSAGEYCHDVQVSLEEENDYYVMSYILPQSWLAEEERSWPVILDPIVQAEATKSNIVDQNVYSRGTADPGAGVIQCGWHSNVGISRGYLKYDQLPELSTADVIVSATIRLCKSAGSSTNKYVEVHKVTETWTEGQMQWATQADYDLAIEDYAVCKAKGYYYWDITEIARDWYANENTGMLFKMPDSVEQAAKSDFSQFWSADYDIYQSEEKPQLIIMFRNNNGLESYWDYTTSSAGRAGTGYINNYTGNLVWVRSDIGFGGNRMPVAISHIYNANDSTNNLFGMGNGWRTNFNQRVYQWSTNTNYYVWEDSDGTAHYFLYDSANTYKDEDGLELTLTTNGSGKEKYCLTDKYGNCSYFDTLGRLTAQVNNQATPSSIGIAYKNDNDYLIDYITDGVGRKYLFEYNDSGLLKMISYQKKDEHTQAVSHVAFSYTGSNLTSITDKDGKVSTYSYTTNSLLESAQDIDGYTLKYTYNTLTAGLPNRIESVTEKHGDVIGGELTITYAQNQTTFTDVNQNVQILQFNTWGNVISVQDDQGRARYARYATDDAEPTEAVATAAEEETTQPKGNQLTLSSKLQNTVGNVLKDSSFENGTNWTAINGATRSIASGTAYIGSKSQKVTSTSAGTAVGVASTSFSVAAGETYTFSAYVKAEASTAYLALHDGTETVKSEVLAADPGWRRLEVSYTATSAATVTARLMTEDTGTIYMDCVQVEKAPTASRYNLLENGDFRHTTGWTPISGRTTATAEGIAQAPAPELSADIYEMAGSMSATNRISQTVNVSGAKDDTFILAGWGKGDSAPLDVFAVQDREFGLILTFNYTDNTTDTFRIHFNPYVDTWQYAASPMVAKKAYSSITVEVAYDYNVNTAYFDGIQLYKEEFGTSYTYDGEGNIVSVIDLQGQKTKYEYTNNDLTKAILPTKAELTYTYDEFHNVETATTETGVKYEFGYDAYGNNTSVSIVNGGNSITSTATYTQDGNRLVSTTDATGKTTTYSYNADTNVLEWVQYPEDTEATRTNYSYDSMYRLASAAATTDTGSVLTASYTYDNDLLKKIETGSTTYNFTYGSFGLRSSVKVDDLNLAQYEYTNRTNYLKKLAYGNEDSVEYTYDTHGRVTQEKYEDGDTVSYKYDNNGALATVTDSATNITTTYYYDFTDRLMKYVESDGTNTHSVSYEYDNINNLTQLVETINGNSYSTAYEYDLDNRVTSVTSGGTTKEYGYDEHTGQLNQRLTKVGNSSIIEEAITYKPGTGQIESVVRKIGDVSTTYNYTYDGNGNILSVFDGTTTTQYSYDSANQLIREDNQSANKTWGWIYDDAGNILEKLEYTYTTGSLEGLTPLDTVIYSYGNDKWGDLLTAYDGQTIEYDPIGNMTNDGTWSYSWEHGRELASMNNGASTWYFTYDANGMRTKRTNNTTTYEYVYNGSQLSQMSITGFLGEDYDFNFFYDANGAPMSFTFNGTMYYYITNLQGDVIKIINAAGQSAGEYSYDAWGRIIYLTMGDSAVTDWAFILLTNPLTYRGYVYDQESGLYYLQSRYYDPEIGRFINADDVDYLGAGGNLTNYNLFAYCGNNPVMGYDPTGHWDWGGVIAGVGIIAGTIITVATFGIGSPIGAIIAGAAITTGAVTTYAAATDSTMVVDLSYSKQVMPNYYVKGGISVVIDFKNDNANFYPHIGFGKGYSDGLSYSVGMVDNYDHPDDYAKHFIDVNVGYNAGIDHCWNPLEKHDAATQATAVTFSSGGSYGVGYDYYFGPKQILAW